MTTTVTHAFVSQIADGADATLVRPSNWNANHTVTLDVDEPIQGQELDLFGNTNLTMQSSTNLLFTAERLLGAMVGEFQLRGIIPSGTFRLHYRDASLVGRNDATIEGTADCLVLDLVPRNSLSLQGVG